MTDPARFHHKAYVRDYDAAYMEAVKEAVAAGLTRPIVRDAKWQEGAGYWAFVLEQGDVFEEVT